MGTGKELARLCSCGIWTDEVEDSDAYRGHQIFDDKGWPISVDEAGSRAFCHLRVFFCDKEIGADHMQTLARLLQYVASTPGESMSLSINHDYGLYEVIIQ